MTIEQALEKANYNPDRIKYKEELFINPVFWKSLGIALKWPKKICPNCQTGYIYDAIICGKKSTCFPNRHYLKIGWLYYWHRFIDYLAEGKSAEDFFKDL